MSTNLTWEEPSHHASRGPVNVMPEIAAALRENPGKWARIDVKPNTALAYAHRHPEIEVIQRNVGKPDHAVYARYIGEEIRDA